MSCQKHYYVIPPLNTPLLPQILLFLYTHKQSDIFKLGSFWQQDKRSDVSNDPTSEKEDKSITQSFN